jgi:hypothetical protein
MSMLPPPTPSLLPPQPPLALPPPQQLSPAALLLSPQLGLARARSGLQGGWSCGQMPRPPPPLRPLHPRLPPRLLCLLRLLCRHQRPLTHHSLGTGAPSAPSTSMQVRRSCCQQASLSASWPAAATAVCMLQRCFCSPAQHLHNLPALPRPSPHTLSLPRCPFLPLFPRLPACALPAVPAVQPSSSSLWSSPPPCSLSAQCPACPRHRSPAAR